MPTWMTYKNYQLKACSQHLEADRWLVSTVQFCPSAPFLTFHYSLITNRPERSCERMGSGSFPLGKSREVECGDGHGRRNIKRFYVAAEGDGESSGGLPADLS